MLTIIKQILDEKDETQQKTSIQGIAMPDQQLEEGDILVFYGANKDLQNFLKQNQT